MQKMPEVGILSIDESLRYSQISVMLGLCEMMKISSKFLSKFLTNSKRSSKLMS